MNLELREAIVKHIFSNFLLIPSNFIDFNKSKSLQNKEFLLPDIIPFDNEQNNNKIWACQTFIDHKEIKLILGDCSLNKDIPEYALIVQVKDSPIYGVYIVNNFYNKQILSDPLIAVTLNGKDWLECQTYLQATFLAGMEQFKDLGFSWEKCIDYKKELNILFSFIKFHNSIYESEI